MFLYSKFFFQDSNFPPGIHIEGGLKGYSSFFRPFVQPFSMYGSNSFNNILPLRNLAWSALVDQWVVTSDIAQNPTLDCPNTFLIAIKIHGGKFPRFLIRMIDPDWKKLCRKLPQIYNFSKLLFSCIQFWTRVFTFVWSSGGSFCSLANPI